MMANKVKDFPVKLFFEKTVGGVMEKSNFSMFWPSTVKLSFDIFQLRAIVRGSHCGIWWNPSHLEIDVKSMKK